MTLGDRFLIACTAVLEAEGEGPEGLRAVVWVIRNRMTAWLQDASEVCLSRLQFSCWNHDGHRRLALSRLFAGPVWVEALDAVDAMLAEDAVDLTGGATHYLNEAATRAGRKDGSVPPWFDEAKVTTRIGRHTFLIA